MYSTNKLIFSLATGLGMVTMNTMVAAASTPVSQEVTNARHEVQIWTTYALSPHLRANDLTVSVKNGKATLTGKVEESVSKELAEQIALGVSGIKEVDNQIVVQGDYVPSTGSSPGYGEMIDDATITAIVKSKLMWSTHTDGLSTNVDTKQGKVTLRGTTKSASAKELAGRLAINTHGVRSVDNQLVIRGNKPSTVERHTEEAERDVADSWIMMKVKSTLLYSSNVDGTDVTVNTDQGVVTLTGKLSNAAERALPIELAENVRGVKRVEATELVF
jgi:hyperosmotically inducible protein